MSGSNVNQAIFLDRDGVLNEVVYHHDIGLLDTPFTVQQFKLLPGAAQAVKKINRQGFLAILVSNQPGVAKQHFNLETHRAMDVRLSELLAAHGAILDDRFYCLEHPDAVLSKYRRLSPWRKPAPGMIFAAIQKHRIDPESSWMIGDSVIDIQAAKKAGIRSILVGGLHCYTCRLLEEKGVRPDMMAKDLLEAVDKIFSIADQGTSA